MSPDLSAILPEMLLAAGALGLLVVPRLRSGRLLGLLTLFFLIAALDLKCFQWVQTQDPLEGRFHGMLVLDPFARFFHLAILFTMGLLTLAVMGYAKDSVRGRREFYALLLLTTVGLLAVVATQRFILIYLGLELVSVLSYLLVGFAKRESLAVEGALKYFLFGALSTGAMLYGFTLLYGMTGAMDFSAMQRLFPQAMVAQPLLGWVGLLLVVVGLGFKVALVPFHMWAPDAYEGAPTPVAAFLSVGPKLAGFAVLVRVLLLGFSPVIHVWTTLLVGLAAVTMTVANLIALKQTNLKRLLAYSSIAHAGFILIGLSVATPFGLVALLYYLVAYVLMNLGAFAGVIAVGNVAGRQDIAAFSGLSRREPVLAFLIALAFLSLAGVPPLAGFFAKLWIFAAALRAQAPGLAVVAAVNSVVAFFYYMRVIKAMYLDPAPAGLLPLPRSGALRLLLAACAAGLLGVGLWQGPWLSFAAGCLPAGRFA